MYADLILLSNSIITCAENSDFTGFKGYIGVVDGIISTVGTGKVPRELQGPNTKYIEAGEKIILPGFVDAHTHLIHGGSREQELSKKLKGVSYLEILKQGGGILNTVENTRLATRNELKTKAKKSLDQMLLHGTTTVEAKSGYGLDFETEVKCLEIAGELNEEHPVDIIRTYMGAHAIPKEFKGNDQGYIALMLDKVMPYVAKHKLAEFMDVFCEEGVFLPGEARILMDAGKRLGFKLKIHADEIIPLQGAELAAEFKAISAEHLLAASEVGIEKLRQSNVTAVLLPGTSFYLMLGKYANARKMLDKGIRVALATDYNPGSCPTENLQAIMTFACFGMKLLPFEIIKGMTINAAYAVDRASEIGSIEVGKKADLLILNAPNLDYIVYHFGINHIDTVIKNGKIVVEQSRLL